MARGLAEAGRQRGPIKYRRMRLYESLRTAHLERAHALTPASIIYRRRRYDFDETVAAGLDLIQAGPIRTALLLFRSPVTALEVNEPLMTSGLRRGALAIAALRVRHPIAHPLTVSYAIENRDPTLETTRPLVDRSGLTGRALGLAARVKARLRESLDAWLRGYVWRRLDRVAFGTEAAQSLYRSALPAAGTSSDTALIPALPERCQCGSLESKDRHKALFLGAFTERKGFPLLLDAWPQVVARLPEARLGLVGTGHLTGLAEQREATDPTVSLDVAPPRDRIHDLLREAAVLVLPSQPTPLWREQVGLPLVEGLAHGCSIVTTTETGLATWLAAHGHEVIRAPSDPSGLSDAVVRALAAQRPASAVVRDLPDVDGRLAADRWLFADPGDPTSGAAQ